MAEELDGRIQEVERSLTTLESQLREQVARTQSGTRTLLVVGIIFIAIVFIYLTIITVKVKPYLEPKALAQVLQGTVDTRIPALKEALQSNAKPIVTALRTRVVEEIPHLSKQAEDRALAFVDELTVKLAAGTDDLMSRMLKTHAKEIKDLVALAAKPGNDKLLQNEFTKDLEELLGTDLDRVLKDYNASMDIVERHVDNLLRPDKQLSVDERLEKRMVGTLLYYLDQTLTVPPPKPPAPAPKGM